AAGIIRKPACVPFGAAAVQVAQPVATIDRYTPGPASPATLPSPTVASPSRSGETSSPASCSHEVAPHAPDGDHGAGVAGSSSRGAMTPASVSMAAVAEASVPSLVYTTPANQASP